MKKIPGTNFHDALSAAMAYTPQAIHTSASSRRKAGFDGRLPGCASGSGARPRGVARAPFFLRALAT